MAAMRPSEIPMSEVKVSDAVTTVPPSMIVSNSLRPLRQAGAVAALAGLVNFAYLGYVLVMRFLLPGVQPGWAAMSFQNAVMFGLLFFVASVVCEYLARVLEEVKDRPLYFIEDERQSSLMLRDSEVRNVVYGEASVEGPVLDKSAP